MKIFSLEPLSFESIEELPEGWQSQDYLALLQAMAYDKAEDIPDSELKAMCQMSLTDLEPAQAAQVTLGYLFADQLSEGQLENLSHQMLTERLWEEHPELSLHEGFFKATQLLHAAFNGTFPKAQAVRFQVSITAEQAGSLSLFDARPAAPLLRLLAQGMPANALLNRLFSDQLAGDSFPEAQHILWRLTTLEQDDSHRVFEMVSSAYWLEEFKYAESYQAPTQADRLAQEES
jgi:hypothetical protein